MSPSPDALVHRSGGDLADYASLLRRRWPIFLVLLAAGVGGGVVSLLAAPSAYTAFAQVLVVATGPQEQTNQVTSRQRESLNLDTEAQIVQSAVVAKKAEKVLKSIPGPVEVSVPPNTSVLQISYTAGDPAAAAAGANAYARAYLAYRSESFTGALTAQLKVLLIKLKQVNASLAKVAATLPGLAKGTAERTVALQQQNVLSRQSYTLTAKYDAFKTVAVIPGSVISGAVAPTEPSAPSPPLHLGGGLMAGLLSGVGAAWLRDRLGTRLRRKPRIRRPTGTGTAGDPEPDGPAGAATMPGASSREVTRAARSLYEHETPVLGTLITGRSKVPTAPPHPERDLIPAPSPHPERDRIPVAPPQPNRDRRPAVPPHPEQDRLPVAPPHPKRDRIPASAPYLERDSMPASSPYPEGDMLQVTPPHVEQALGEQDRLQVAPPHPEAAEAAHGAEPPTGPKGRSRSAPGSRRAIPPQAPPSAASRTTPRP
ncbi:Chain length determinant protein [Streptosporangium subroseum]|uniref:Chain length determinant protein n=1 Tax=Streptosporangium subroseum TaxID=106412 RepID=A0A239MG39_9ACTN|nr:Wzz/FepE/Etk N-terminal domain-containing protein [Streptosporangium subroseum]SNT41631.1 Chain length determinant protein [Streptosporangium subroseum]